MSDFDFIDWFFEHIFAFVAIFVATVILVPAAYTVACYHNDRVLTCHVVDKDRAGQDATMRVYTEDCGNFVVQDATFAGNFHSSDTYREIEPGNTYRLHVNGYRIPFFSEFPNILDVKRVG